jgi:phosphoribosyl 1,2-cyclic phosphodiesterase
VRALLCGVRGSTPVSGIEYTAVGGATSCVAIPGPGVRWLVLDAGTGFTRLADQLGEAPFRGTILLTHLHWDHTHGLPFLPNADRPDAEIELRMPAQGDDGGEAVDVLARAMSPPHFPIDPSELRGTWRFSTIASGRHEVEGFTIIAAEVHHKGGRTLGFRVESPSGSLAYVPDHAPRLASSEEYQRALDLIDGVDVLVHGGGFVDGERALADVYGHATIGDAIEFARVGGVGRLVVVHHGPHRTDGDIVAIENEPRLRPPAVPIQIGREGHWVESRRPAHTNS